MQALEDVLSFWFAPDGRERWFEPDPAFDAEIARRFAPMVGDAAAGRLDAFAGEPRGALALCVLLDQFPRSIWRGTPRAFAQDEAARRVADRAVAAGLDRDLPPEQRLFLYLPFEHSESLADQERSVALMAGLGDAEWLDYAVRHRDVIARFGRFPHRNAVLGRESTPEEAAFLAEPGSSF
ncbi:MAG TPA: DUF924 family protein [Geminicoccaceae bacterium]|nr:DUF924 family protein [Geminicoccaceae bacterium]